MKNKTGKVRKVLIAAAAAVAVFFCAAFLLLYFGVVHLNAPDEEAYPVRGVDVSHHQGKIDWETLSSQGVSFAFIKATEGSSYVDPRFEENRAAATATGLRVGAYHFFSFDSTGEAQAKLFCGTVGDAQNMLPPVIDVEFYGKYKSGKGVDFPRVKKELRALVDILTDEYGVKPVIYADKDTYEAIVKGDFSDCGLWYRSVYSAVPDTIGWTFWQYSNRHVLKGYDGGRYIDMNVFYGDAVEFEKYPD
ncbi:MAG: hypothetical protein J5585_09450 [Clostridia bacterium]|nr:hypothetical protein [Clostridia bacterium]